jgi:hypothetical protein
MRKARVPLIRKPLHRPIFQMTITTSGGLTGHGQSRQVHVMQTRDHWSPRHSTLMRQRALVLAILQRGVHETPAAKPDRITPRQRAATRPI